MEISSMDAKVMTRPAKPDHVPDHLFWDHDLDEFVHEQGGDPFLAVSPFYEGPPVFYASSVGREQGWVIARFAEQEEAFIDFEHFSVYGRESENRPFEFGGLRLIPNGFDPPVQRAYRRILEPLFTPKSVKQREEEIRRVCRDLLSRIENQDGADFKKDFARYFPTSIFLGIMGMPMDRFEQFMEW